MNHYLSEARGLLVEGGLGVYRSVVIAADHTIWGVPVASKPLRDRRHDPVVLFLPGFLMPANAPVYWSFYEAFDQAGYRVITHPLSWLQYNFGDITVNREILRRFAQTNGCVAVLGHSYGGVLAYHVAFEYGTPLLPFGAASPLLYTPGQKLQEILVALGVDSFDVRWRLEELREKAERNRGRLATMTVTALHDEMVAPESTRLGGIHSEHDGRHTPVMENPRVFQDGITFLRNHLETPKPRGRKVFYKAA